MEARSAGQAGGSGGPEGATSRGVRRVFVSTAEIPTVLAGALRGDAVALRRILGGRRGGRIGVLLFSGGLVAAFPSSAIPLGLALHLALVWLLARAPGDAPALRYSERLRLSLWTTGPLLLLCLPLRLLVPASVVPGILATLVGHALLVRGLTSGLRSPRERTPAGR